MRTCRDCGESLSLNAANFYRRGDGYQNICKKCHDIRVKEWRKSKIEVSPELAERILSLPSMDAYSPAKLAKTCKCSVGEVKSVLLNERRWRSEFEKEAVG